MRRGVAGIIVGIGIWTIGLFFALWFSILVEGSNPDWQSQDTPDCYIGLQTLILGTFLSYIPFGLTGAAVFVPSLNAFHSSP